MINKILKDVSALRRQVAETSISVFAQIYLKHYIKINPSRAHNEMYENLYRMHIERNIKFACAAPRDLGKSTIVSLVDVLYSICFRKEKFILILSNTAKLATGLMDHVKNELMGNELIRLDFPEVFEFHGEPKPPRWRDNDIETRTKIRIVASGVNEASRGIRYSEHRPSWVIADDIEKGDTYASIESIEKAKDLFNKTFLRIGTEGTNFIIIGTFFHPHCLLGEYLDTEKHPEWTGKIYKALEAFPENQVLWQAWSNIYNNRQEYLGQTGPAIARKFYDDNMAEMDKGAKSLWPEKWGIYDLMVKHENNPTVFSSECQNAPSDPKTQTFKQDELHYWSNERKGDEDLLKSLSDDLSYFGSCDPSTGSDYSAIIVLVRDNKTKILYVLVADIKRRSVNQTIDDIVSYAKRFHFTKFAVESNNFQKLMVDQLKERCKLQEVNLNIEEMNNRSHKKERIISLHSITATGGLRFNKNHRLLIDQLCLFPICANDDGPDCLEMAVRIAEKKIGKLTVTIVGPSDDSNWYRDYHNNFGWPKLF